MWPGAAPSALEHMHTGREARQRPATVLMGFGAGALPPDAADVPSDWQESRLAELQERAATGDAAAQNEVRPSPAA